MTLARLLRFVSPASEDRGPAGTPIPSDGFPCDDPMLLGIPQPEFTASVRRALWVLLSEARNLRGELERTRVLLRKAEQAVDGDHLLPVLNRRAFVRELDRQLASASRYQTSMSLAYIDLDGFKVVNDTYGHACGDALLAHFASVLLSGLRSSDTVGRLGGDEFGLILLHTEESQAWATCSRIAGAAEDRPLVWNGAPSIPIRFTAGVVQVGGEMSAETAIAAADAVMYGQRSLRQ